MSIAWGPQGPWGPESYLDERIVGCLLKGSVRIVGKEKQNKTHVSWSLELR